MTQRNPTEGLNCNAHTRARVMSVSYQPFRCLPLNHRQACADRPNCSPTRARQEGRSCVLRSRVRSLFLPAAVALGDHPGASLCAPKLFTKG
jgi:hypothetical protein